MVFLNARSNQLIMNSTISTNYHLTQKVKDEQFDIDRISYYHLSLQVGSTRMRFCIHDLQKNRCLWLEDYTLAPQESAELQLPQVQAIFENHQILQAGFWKEITISFTNRKFSLIPAALFQDDRLADYLRPIASVDSNTEQILNFKHIGADITNVFPAPYAYTQWFKSKYPNKTLRLVHNTSALIEAALRNSEPASSTKKMFLSIEESHVSILVTRGKVLEFCNVFPYNNDADFIYFVMFVMDELKMNPDADTVILWGELVPNSPIYEKLYRYIRNVQFGNRPSMLSFGYQFDELLDHRYYDLFCVHLCK